MGTKNKIPLRQCTGCREMKSKKEMIRVLKTPEDEIVLDATGQKERQRCICLSCHRSVWKRQSKASGLERSLEDGGPGMRSTKT